MNYDNHTSKSRQLASQCLRPALYPARSAPGTEEAIVDELRSRYPRRRMAADGRRQRRHKLYANAVSEAKHFDKLNASL